MSRLADHPQPRLAARELHQQFCRPIGAAIINEDDLEIRSSIPLKFPTRLGQKRLNNCRFIEARQDDGQDWSVNRHVAQIVRDSGRSPRPRWRLKERYDMCDYAPLNLSKT